MAIEYGRLRPVTAREIIRALGQTGDTGTLRMLWDQLKRACQARPDTDCAEGAPIAGQHPIDLAAFRDGGHHPIDQSQTKVLEAGVEFESASDIAGGRQLVFVARPWVENLGDQLAHRGPIRSKKAIDFGEDQPWYDDEPCGGQDLFIVRETRLAAGRAGEGSEQPAGVGNDWGTHPSRSRNSSDSSPRFVSVDSKRRVDGGRRRGEYGEAARRRPFRISSEAEWPAARARFNARTSSSSRRTVVDMSRAIPSPYNGKWGMAIGCGPNRKLGARRVTHHNPSKTAPVWSKPGSLAFRSSSLGFDRSKKRAPSAFNIWVGNQGDNTVTKAAGQ